MDSPRACPWKEENCRLCKWESQVYKDGVPSWGPEGPANGPEGPAKGPEPGQKTPKKNEGAGKTIKKTHKVINIFAACPYLRSVSKKNDNIKSVLKKIYEPDNGRYE